MITGPGVFHQGFNSGYNIAQAVNFAIPSWKPFAKFTNSCYCISGTWKVARNILQNISNTSRDKKINSSVFRHVYSTNFLVIAETSKYSEIERQLPTLKNVDVRGKWLALEPIKDEPIWIFSIYSMRLFQTKKFQ